MPGAAGVGGSSPGAGEGEGDEPACGPGPGLLLPPGALAVPRLRLLRPAAEKRWFALMAVPARPRRAQ